MAVFVNPVWRARAAKRASRFSEGRKLKGAALAIGPVYYICYTNYKTLVRGRAKRLNLSNPGLLGLLLHWFMGRILGKEVRMTLIDSNSLLSISEASQKGVSALIRAAEQGQDQVVLRNNKPVAAVVSMRRLEEEQQLREDLADVTMLAARMLTTDGTVSSLDEVLAQFGFTRHELRNTPD